MTETMGRPTAYTDAMAALILERIMSGMSLREVCRSDDTPARSTVHKWLADIEGFSDQYARACDVRADEVFDEMFDIADDASNDWMESNKPEDVGFSLNGEHIQRSRLRIDTRKWALARMAPKKYGDKLDLNHGGAVNINLPTGSDKV